MSKKQIKMRNRIIAAFCLYAVFFGMELSGMMERFPVFVQFILFLVPYLIVGYDILIRAAKNIRNGRIFDENFLMTIATYAAFALKEFPEACAVMLFYQVGELFQSVAVGKSRQSITDMMNIAPEVAFVEGADGALTETDPEDVETGSILVIRPGEKVPVDSEVVEGESFLDTAALTGESVPRAVRPGDTCISGCLNKEGTLRVRTLKRYEDSTVARILELVENASDKKARLENFITRFAYYYTPVVTISALLLAIIPPLFLSQEFRVWILRACTFLIVSCPCALVISVPLGFFGGIGAASKIGVLVKGSNYLEAASKVTQFVCDKTGTLTEGTFSVTGLKPADGVTGEHLLYLAACAETYSNHPIAKSVREACNETVAPERLSGAKEHAGSGIEILLDGKPLYAGNQRLMEAALITGIPSVTGGTVIYVAYDGRYCGAIVISDTVKNEAHEAVRGMKEAGIRQAVMLTGDHEDAANIIADEVGIDTVYAELLPGDKVEVLERLMTEHAQEGYTAFAGDGINDAPSLMRADVGIAMGSLGSDAAIEAADIVIMDDDLNKITALLRIAKKTMSIVRMNIVFAIGVKVLILILGAAGIANLWLAVFADVGVAVIAILNSMRLLRYRA